MRNGMLSVAVCAVFATASFEAMSQGDTAAKFVSPGEADLALANAQVGATALKAKLLQPVVWVADWERFGDKGQSEILFEARADKVVAKIRNLTLPTTCEHEVTIANDRVKFDGCYDFDITLRFDPSDKTYPFKGGSQKGYGYRLQPKDAG